MGDYLGFTFSMLAWIYMPTYNMWWCKPGLKKRSRGGGKVSGISFQGIPPVTCFLQRGFFLKISTTFQIVLPGRYKAFNIWTRRSSHIWDCKYNALIIMYTEYVLGFVSLLITLGTVPRVSGFNVGIWPLSYNTSIREIDAKSCIDFCLPKYISYSIVQGPK